MSPRAVLFALLLSFVGFGNAALAQLRVTSLHPIVGDLARAVGGERVVVHDLLPIGDDPHSFEPTPREMAALADAEIILASGKGMEGYLDKLETATTAPIVEVGKRVPSILVEAKDSLFLCCPEHAYGSLDPHWWHSPRNMGRAAKIVADALTKVDPAGRSTYRTRASAHSRTMAELDKWVRKQLEPIPRAKRKLVTAHLAFGYFCKEYGFQAMGLQGLNRVADPTPKDLAEAVNTIRKHKLTIAFPEALANPEGLQMLHRETGIRLGEVLYADTLSADATTYKEMIESNVRRIRAGFGY